MTRLKYKNIHEYLHEEFIDVLAKFSAHTEVGRDLCLSTLTFAFAVHMKIQA